MLSVFILTAAPAWAFDVGDPSFRVEGMDTTRLEVFVEWMNRDLDLEYDPPMIGTPAGGPTSVASSAPPGHGSSFNRDMMFVRYTVHPSELISAHFDLAVNGESSAGDQNVVLGGAIRGLLKRQGPFELSAQFDAHFVPETRFQSPLLHSTDTAEPYSITGEQSAYEVGFSLLGSMTAELGETGKLVAYAGPKVSAFRSEFSTFSDYYDTGERFWLSGVETQSSVLGVVVGSRIQFNETWSARVESRLVDEKSLSFGVSASF